MGLTLSATSACLSSPDCRRTDTSCNSAAVGGQNGAGDRILTSTDGVAWKDSSLALADRFEKPTHTGSRFVAVGRAGVTADSND